MVSFTTFILGIIIAIAGYFALHKTDETINQDIFINAPPGKVFEKMKDPKYLITSHDVVTDVEITKYTTDEEGIAHYELIVTEKVPILGSMQQARVSKTYLTIRKVTSWIEPFPLAEVEINYTMETVEGGTRLVEETFIRAPWLFQRLFYGYTKEHHYELLVNAKKLGEM